MALLTALLVAVLMFAGVLLILRRNIVEVTLGFVFITNAVNLFLVAMGGWSAAKKPPILLGENPPLSTYTDPLPHALILTAIVISFGVTAFMLVLLKRGHEEYRDLELTEKPRDAEEL